MPISTMSALGNVSVAPGAMTGTGSDRVTAIDKSAGTITFRHGPIPGMHWPAMTMEFKANPASLVDQVAVGDTVTFDVKVEGSLDEVTAVKKP
ncbi:MAG: copper-binding protein [Betaproteobacteria bacterium]|nr:copper-binding protein [Betaproteobacteria bacterium]MDE2623672.1 copper-binding protein [Betaproteobacteria bacterium]